MACSTLTLQKEERLAWFEETTSEDDRRGGLWTATSKEEARLVRQDMPWEGAPG